jgi:hypothetical protein
MRSVRALVFGLGCSALFVVWVSSAGAAAPPPESLANCYGGLTAVPTTDEPNLLAYKFHCDTRITAYTLIITRRRRDAETVDDFSTSADVLNQQGTIVPTESFNCEGGLPGDGVNCNAGAGGHMSAWNYAVGQIDLTDPYCANLPKGAPAGTAPEPQALVQVIVTDITGAQDGPFRLGRAPACPKLKLKQVKKTTKHHHKGSHHKGTRR